jgi:hypothetical protein
MTSAWAVVPPLALTATRYYNRELLGVVSIVEHNALKWEHSSVFQDDPIKN